MVVPHGISLVVHGAGTRLANGRYYEDWHTTTSSGFPIFLTPVNHWCIGMSNGKQWSIYDACGNRKYYIQPIVDDSVTREGALKFLELPWTVCDAGKGGEAPPPTLSVVTVRKRKHNPEFVLAIQERAWKQQKFADAQIVCDGVRIPVHRSTLAAASRVFDVALSSSSMKDGQLAVYEIKDVPFAAVQAMLQHIYTGKVEVAAGILIPLFDLAVQYELCELGSMVADMFVEGLTVDNVRERVVTLKRHQETESVQYAFMHLLETIRADASLQLFAAAV